MNIYIIVVIAIGILCILCNNEFQYFLMSIIYSNIAPTSEEDEYKKNTAYKLFDTRHELGKCMKQDIIECNLQKILTIDYKTIKNVLDKKYFEQLTDNFTKPILIKGVYSDAELKTYNYHTLKKAHGDIAVEALYKNNNKFNATKTTLSNYIDMIQSGKKYYLTVNNSLANALNKKTFINFFDPLFGSIGMFNIFMGNRGTYTHLHCELAASCAIQLNGVKKWYLVDPKYSVHMDGIPDKNGFFVMSSKGFHHTLRTNEFEQIPRYEIICEKGDFLYVPPWVWHEAYNLTDESIMLSFRPTLFTTPYKNNPYFTLMGLKNSIGFNEMIYPIVVQMGVYDPNKDDVVESLQHISNRTPAKYFVTNE